MAKQIFMPEEGDRVRRKDSKKIETIAGVFDYSDDSWTVELEGKNMDEEEDVAEEISVSEYDEVNHVWKEDA